MFLWAPAELAEVDIDLGALDLKPNRIDQAMGQFGELLLQAEFVEQSQRAGVHGVAAKITQEIGVLLHHRDVDPRAGQQQTEHDAGRAAPGNDAASAASVGHAPILACWLRWPCGIG